MHRKLTDNRIIFLYMKIHCSPINRHLPIPSSIWPFVTYSCPPAETGSLWPFHGMGIPISISLFFGSSMTSLNLSIHHRTNKITTWSKTFLFLFFLWIYLHLNFSNKLAVLNKGGHIYDHSPFCEHDISLTFWIPIQALIKLIMKHKHQSLSTYPRYPLHNRLGALRSLFGFTNNIPARPCWNLIKKERGWLFWDL